jgi:hypothetical protein
MAEIISVLERESVFEPSDINTMSIALDDVRKELKLDGNAAELVRRQRVGRAEIGARQRVAAGVTR